MYYQFANFISEQHSSDQNPIPSGGYKFIIYCYWHVDMAVVKFSELVHNQITKLALQQWSCEIQ